MKAIAFVCAVLLLAGCEERIPLGTPSVQPPPRVRTTAATPSRTTRRAAPVKSAGPLKLAMVGAYMDAQERDFRARLKPTGALVSRIGDDLAVSWRNDALFEDDEFSSNGSDAMEEMAMLLRHYDHSDVQVAGYTDTSGTDAENLVLSANRAKAVAARLISDGVSSDRVSSQGYGAARLRVATGPGKKEPKNRRIEIRVIAHPEG